MVPLQCKHIKFKVRKGTEPAVVTVNHIKTAQIVQAISYTCKQLQTKKEANDEVDENDQGL